MAQTTVEEGQALESTTVGIFRTATVVKGGRRFSFAALVVVGDRGGNVGLGYGKGRGVPVAIEKAQKEARKNLFRVPMNGSTLPHPVEGRFGSSRVRMLPAAPGTGVVAGGTVRAVLEMAGVGDTITKAFGSSNQKNLCKAVVQGLQSLRTRESVAAARNVEIDSTAVDEMLEASKRSLEEQESASGETDEAKQQKAQRASASRSGGGGVGSKKKEDESKDKKQKGKGKGKAKDEQGQSEASAEGVADTAQATGEAPADEAAGDQATQAEATEAQPTESQADDQTARDQGQAQDEQQS
jgi:small subunit ribosomal protein S5